MMISNNEYERYKRQLVLEQVGEEGQCKLTQAKVLVVGCGGLGVPVMQYLAGAGVGHLTIVDGDQVELSNIHRQVMYSTQDVGRAKSEVAAERIRAINSMIEVNEITNHLDFENGGERVSEADIVVDGTDNYATRYLINDLALLCGKPVVSGALHKFEAQLMVYNYENGPTYRCLFPDEKSRGFGCTEVGILGPMAGMLGSLMALEVLKIVLGTGNVLSGQVQSINGLTNQWVNFTFRKKEEAVMQRKLLLKNQLKSETYG